VPALLVRPSKPLRLTARFCLACCTELSAKPAGQDERRIVSVVFVDLVGFTAIVPAL
jgi:hypothetical protein